MIPKMVNLDKLSNKIIFKKYKNNPNNIYYSEEIFKRLINNEFSSTETVEVCILILTVRFGRWFNKKDELGGLL